MRVWFAILALLTATPVFADVTAVATVDQRRIGFGDSFTYTITINGASGGLQAPNIPPVDGLQFQGPSVSTSMSWVNGQSSQAVNLTYRVTPTRLGQFTIPAAEVTVAGKTLRTEPITIAVEKNAAASTLADGLFARIQFDNQPLYLGQTAPLNIVLFVRGDVPLQGLNGFQAQADGLNYKFLDKVKQGTQVISGQNFSVLLIDGAITPTQVGKQPFGPVVIKCQLRTPKRGGNDFFDQFFNRIEVREVPLTVDPITIDVLPLPDAGRPAEFAGAVGQWKLDVTAKPTEVAIGDPITLTIRISGTGNIDLVTPPKLTGLDEFKTYDPTTKTSKNELNTAGERVIQQVLVPKSTAVKQLPEIRLSYFDPVTKTYTNAVAPPINLTVKTGTGGQSTVISAGLRVRPEEKLGQDIVYLKGDRGPAAAAVPFCATPVFWVLNFAPVVALLGGLGWKRRTDRLRGDVAYARRSRAARGARKLLATATTPDAIQQALQHYLGDRLNIPSAGITAAVAEERQLPGAVREIFEACDAARFAGMAADVAALKQRVEQVIDELETATL